MPALGIFPLGSLGFVRISDAPFAREYPNQRRTGVWDESVASLGTIRRAASGRGGVVNEQGHSRLAALVCLPSLLFLHGCDNPQQQAKAELPPAAVTVAPVAEDKITPTVTFTGRVQAQDKVDLRARIDGFLEKRLFNEGQDVKKGDLLFVIEQAPYKSAIAEIKADIQKAEAALTLANIEVKRATELVAKEVGTQK